MSDMQEKVNSPETEEKSAAAEKPSSPAVKKTAAAKKTSSSASAAKKTSASAAKKPSSDTEKTTSAAKKTSAGSAAKTAAAKKPAASSTGKSSSTAEKSSKGTAKSSSAAKTSSAGKSATAKKTASTSSAVGKTTAAKTSSAAKTPSAGKTSSAKKSAPKKEPVVIPVQKDEAPKEETAEKEVAAAAADTVTAEPAPTEKTEPAPEPAQTQPAEQSESAREREEKTTDEPIEENAQTAVEIADVKADVSEEKKESGEHLLEVKNLKKYFLINKAWTEKNRKYLRAVDGVSFTLDAGKTIGIVGESGCGKTTMGRTILRLNDVTGGEILFNGVDLAKLKGGALRKLRPQFQMIFQDPYSSLSPRLPVGEIIGEAVKVHKIVPKSEYKDYILDVMQKCGLQTHYFERYPHEFSGGQRQRICIAKVLALKPKLVICDEPVSALDVSIQAQIINLFKDLQEKNNLAYLFISHDLSVVEHISDDVGVMYLGNMVEFAHKRDLFANPMHPYTQALLSAVPTPDPDVKINRIMLKGDIPSPANPPKGCKFHTRCNKCMDICKEVEPKFKDYGSGHCVACHLYPQD